MSASPSSILTIISTLAGLAKLLAPTKAGRTRRARNRYHRWANKGQINREQLRYCLDLLAEGIILRQPPPLILFDQA